MCRRDLGEQPSELHAGQEASLADGPASPAATRGQDQRAREIAVDESLAGGRVEASAKRRQRVADRAIRESPAAPGAIREPADEALQRSPVEVGEPEIRGEVGQGEGRQQPTVFLADLLAHPVMPAAGVAGDPPQHVVVQGRPAPLLAGFDVARELIAGAWSPTANHLVFHIYLQGPGP
ncbi:MAG TPA: hypothetical protein VNY31_01875 [Solirubrobacteraceae bacterium]|nr:hypothetical protein [Solirubrobacteraceae bacterium]